MPSRQINIFLQKGNRKKIELIGAQTLSTDVSRRERKMRNPSRTKRPPKTSWKGRRMRITLLKKDLADCSSSCLVLARIRSGSLVNHFSAVCHKLHLPGKGKSMTPCQGNTILCSSSQQLPRLRLGPMKGFLS